MQERAALPVSVILELRLRRFSTLISWAKCTVYPLQVPVSQGFRTGETLRALHSPVFCVYTCIPFDLSRLGPVSKQFKLKEI